jgi:GT2 family glycosyltransferase
MTCSTAIVVVDNGSTDHSASSIREQCPDVVVIETGANLGYAAGNNYGFDYIRMHTDADAILVLNNDTIADPEMLRHLVAEYEAANGKAIIGPEVRYADAPGTIWCIGGTINWWRGYTTNIGIGAPAGSAYPGPTDVPFIVGCAMLIPVSALAKVRGFDPRYFMYWEEVDWCVRAQRAGYRMRVVPDAVLYHKVPIDDERPSPRVLYYLTRNRLLLMRTHLPWHRQLLAIPWTLWGQIRTAMELVSKRDWSRERALMYGIWDAARGRTGIRTNSW